MIPDDLKFVINQNVNFFFALLEHDVCHDGQEGRQPLVEEQLN